MATSEGVFLLKRWSRSAKAADLEKTLALMSWLELRQIPVPEPIKFLDGEVLLSLDSGAWSLFSFIEGEYFSGAGDQLEAAAEMSGRLMETLSQLPSNYWPESGAKYFTTSDSDLLNRVKDTSSNWNKLFGAEYASLSTEGWPVLMREWDQLFDSGLGDAIVQASHFDLHPHNILVSRNTVTALLDFESCKLMQPGYALSFGALKQCRQTVALHQLKESAALVGARYTTRLVDCYPDADHIVSRIGDFAVSEALRRICIILRLNLESGDKTWNHVLPIQLGHIGEARALFGY